MKQEQISTETHAAFLELELMGMIEFKRPGQATITEKGIDRTSEIIRSLPRTDAILLLLETATELGSYINDEEADSEQS